VNALPEIVALVLFGVFIAIAAAGMFGILWVMGHNATPRRLVFKTSSPKNTPGRRQDFAGWWFVIPFFAAPFWLFVGRFHDLTPWIAAGIAYGLLIVLYLVLESINHYRHTHVPNPLPRNRSNMGQYRSGPHHDHHSTPRQATPRAQAPWHERDDVLHQGRPGGRQHSAHGAQEVRQDNGLLERPYWMR